VHRPLPCNLLLQVIRTKDENKARGYGFVSFLDPMDCAKAIREMNGKYLGSR
jgi:RNA recognition motif-containing protein